ncbi:MFS transporter [Gordonia sp. OPL2]|uniref:MFS transporter n=1 Tax=Gordonia sp. OPL2 TaxID=2486274 RepID=UPI00165543B2|nr:MFS transporter [Gordonia sp. OPL2]ROZ99233.1 MFS transporter [Gordonia sp. OPL2]
MFADPDVAGAGLSAAEISSLFVLWSLCSFVFEIPTGMLADRMPRRWLLVAGPVVTGAGFALWTWWPSYGAFAAGFVLWSAGSSLRSGSLQALLFDTLAARGESLRYAALAGRVRAMGACGVLLGTALAAPLTAWGGYEAAGAASLVSCGVCALASAALPEDAPPGRSRRDDRPAPGTEPAADGAPGLSAVAGMMWRRRSLRRVVVLLVALTWVAALDEYLPLLADEMWSGRTESGRSAASGVAVLMVVVAVGDIGGGIAAGRTATAGLAARRLARWLTAGAVALAVGALTGHPVGILLVAFAFGVFGWSMVMVDAAMQQRVPSSSRATVTSVVGVGEEMVAIAAYGAWALGSGWLPPTALFAIAAVPYVVVGVYLRLSAPGATTARASAR